MSERLRPGVYHERVDASAPAIAALRTDVAGFVGIAEKGPLNTPVPVQSFRQFQAHFGGFTGAGYLAYAVHAFFEGGGRRCWIVRIASAQTDPRATPASITVSNGTGPAWRIEASSPGVWGNELSIALRTERRAQTLAGSGDANHRYAIVASVAGFARGDLVSVSQPDGSGGVRVESRVLSHVDALQHRLYWVHPETGLGPGYEQPIEGFDRNLAWTVERLSYSLQVFRRGVLEAKFSGLSTLCDGVGYAPDVARMPDYPTRLVADEGLPAPAPPVVVNDMTDGKVTAPLIIQEGRQLPLSGGIDGLASLSVDDFTGIPFAPTDADEVRALRQRGISALDLVDEIAVVAVPDIVIRPAPDPVYDPPQRPAPDPCRICPPQPEPAAPTHQPVRDFELPPVFPEDAIFRVQSRLVEHCERRGDRFAILDAPFTAAQDDEVGVSAVRAWRARFDTSYAALYYPWLWVVEPRGTEPVRAVPPSGHVAGSYARHDIETGVHRAPANTTLPWLQDVTVRVSDGMHEILNPNGINPIRTGAYRGLRVFGARTLSSDPALQQINVRRLLLMVREAIDVSTQWAAFEPNDYDTRRKLVLALRGFLSALWQKGALVGAAPEQAFFVKCDEENNPPDQRANGRLLAEVGVASSYPMEFIVLRVGRQGNELQISETSVIARAA